MQKEGTVKFSNTEKRFWILFHKAITEQMFLYTLQDSLMKFVKTITLSLMWNKAKKALMR